MENSWNQIPLEDYELHMQHESVGQSFLLNNLTKKYLERLCPEIVMFLGIAGGNGLEHINNNVTNQVFGIDINQNYLDETGRRFKDQIPNLTLVNIDIAARTTEQITKANLIWAALIFEYIDIEKCFEFINYNIQNKGYLVVTIQENNGISSVSRTGIESIKSIGHIFRIVNENDLLAFADKSGFIKTGFEENALPNGKALKTYTFLKQQTA